MSPLAALRASLATYCSGGRVCSDGIHDGAERGLQVLLLLPAQNCTQDGEEVPGDLVSTVCHLFLLLVIRSLVTLPCYSLLLLLTPSLLFFFFFIYTMLAFHGNYWAKGDIFLVPPSSKPTR
ncbi:hypothetical protein E2C01_098920 [Portunus trituberculatus]|uniref:Uncharacterized protein n=1 Tax=Portunus trituberculatus TaxID=210409 RepID=A0A5B7K2G9_PORTR|nr:hypothetical protein [Portunus trituberculatus]